MFKRILILAAATLMATACAHGVKQTPADPPTPNLSIPAGQLAVPADDLPQPLSGRRGDLLANHVDVAHAFHDVVTDYTALICTVTGATGITINGAAPVQPAACWPIFPPSESVHKSVDKSVHKHGSSPMGVGLRGP